MGRFTGMSAADLVTASWTEVVIKITRIDHVEDESRMITLNREVGDIIIDRIPNFKGKVGDVERWFYTQQCESISGCLYARGEGTIVYVNL